MPRGRVRSSPPRSRTEWRERCAALSPRREWVAVDPDAYPLASLQRLIAASPAARSFVIHVDMPVFVRNMYEDLWKARAATPRPDCSTGIAAIPSCLSPKALARIARLDPAKDRLDAWLRDRHVAEVPVSTGAIH